MTKEEQEIALRVANETILNISRDNPTSQYQIEQFASRFLAAVDAERGKEAVCHVVDNDDGESILDIPLPVGTALYLSPRKEGWKLVPFDANEAMVNACLRIDLINDGDLEGIAHNIWNAMIAAAPTPEEGK